MKIPLTAVVFFILIINTIFAQTGKVGINTTAPQAMLHVKDSSVLFSGSINLPTTPGDPPASGAGARMMWYADKAAFRAGYVNLNNPTVWDKNNIGIYSTAIGIGTTAPGPGSTAMGSGTTASGGISTAIGYSTDASGEVSTAMGSGTTASGNYSTAMGYNTTVSGFSSTAMGFGTTASGYSSTAIGNGTTASGSNSTAMGIGTTASGVYSTTMGISSIAKGYSSTVVGLYNDSVLNATQTSILPTTPLFIIGNGDDNNNRRNAVVVLKNGNIGINTSVPGNLLHIVKGTAPSGPRHPAAIATLESNQGGYLQFTGQDDNEFGILAGNSLTTNRSGILFMADSSMRLRAGGQSTRIAIAKSGDVGINNLTPTSKLHINGSISKPIQTTVSNITLDANDYTTIITPTASTVVVTLPAASTCSGREYVIVNKDGNNFTFNLNYLDLANVSTNALPATTSITLQSDGSNWHRIR